jgi:hypothetical protein
MRDRRRARENGKTVCHDDKVQCQIDKETRLPIGMQPA